MDTSAIATMSGSLVRTIPREALPASAGVDALHLSANLKSAFRSRLTAPAFVPLVKQWCERHGLAVRFDQDGFVCVARTTELADRILEVDRNSEPHERSLGLLLNYPFCCAEVVSLAGESNIDNLAQQIRQWGFKAEYKLIDPSGYLDGTSLICHLPCSPDCVASLALARSALRFVNQHRREPGFERWSSWLCLQHENPAKASLPNG